jgi:hypothetical protein
MWSASRRLAVLRRMGRVPADRLMARSCQPAGKNLAPKSIARHLVEGRLEVVG